MVPIVPRVGFLKRLSILLLAFVAGASCRIGEIPWKEDYDKFRSISRGMTENEDRERLGEPTFVHAKGVPPDKYCVPGWACEPRAINHRLLIFRAGEPIAFIYLDANNTVEHVFVGGS